MRQAAPALMLLSLLAIPATASEPSGYRIAGGMPGGTSCSSDCGASCESSRWQRLIDFALYRPLTCKHCVEPAYYVPPLHAWFPNCCHANAGRGCATGGCAKGGCVKNNCSSCAASLGTPISVAGWNRTTRAPAPAVQAFAPPPVGSPYSPTMKPAQPAPSAGYRVQPTGYNVLKK